MVQAEENCANMHTLKHIALYNEFSGAVGILGPSCPFLEIVARNGRMAFQDVLSSHYPSTFEVEWVFIIHPSKLAKISKPSLQPITALYSERPTERHFPTYKPARPAQLIYKQIQRDQPQQRQSGSYLALGLAEKSKPTRSRKSETPLDRAPAGIPRSLGYREFMISGSAGAEFQLFRPNSDNSGPRPFSFFFLTCWAGQGGEQNNFGAKMAVFPGFL